MDTTTTPDRPDRSWRALWQLLKQPRGVLCALALLAGLGFLIHESLKDPVADFLLESTAPGMLRKAGAIDVRLGALGVKRVVRSSPNYFELREPLPWSAAVRSETRSMITHESSLAAGLKRLGVSYANVDTHARLTKRSSEKKRLAVRTIATPQALLEEINAMIAKDSSVRRLFGADARIVTAVVEIHDYIDSSQTSGAASGAVEQVNVDIDLTVTQTWDLSRGTVRAFRLARLCWSPDRSRVEDLRADIAGRADKCPPPLVDGTGPAIVTPSK